MTVVERAEKAIDTLRNANYASKLHEVQSAAGTLGRCMGALGSHPSLIKQYMDLLPYSVHSLLTLASHESAEVRLVGDEALNRMIVGGLPFHASKINIHIQNHIDAQKSPRWLRAALSRVCLGNNWLRPGIGKGRNQAKSLFSKIKQILNRATESPALILSTIEANLPRILKALSPFTLKDELQDVLVALFQHVTSSEASIRRSAANCIASMCQNQKAFISFVVNTAIDGLWSDCPSQHAITGWFGVLKNVFQLNPIGSLPEATFSTSEFFQMFQLCLMFIASSDHDHNVHNAALECLTAILTNCGGRVKAALERKIIPNSCLLEYRSKKKKHQRSLSSISMVMSAVSNSSSMMNLVDDITIGDQSESLVFSGALALSNLSRVQSPHTSLEDLSIKETKTPDFNDNSDANSDCHMYDISAHIAEKLEGLNDITDCNDDSKSDDCLSERGGRVKLSIGSYSDEDKRIKYCARLIVSRFLLSGHHNEAISDRFVRVSVKATALNCLAAILEIYPEAMTLYLDKDGESSNLNPGGPSEASTISNTDNSNEYILERNVCYQESLTDSFGDASLNKSLEINSQSSLSAAKSSSEKRQNFKESTDPSSSIKNVLNTKEKERSLMSNDSVNVAMSVSNFTIGSNVTSHDPMSTDYQFSTSGDLLSSSQDLEIKFDHFGESTTSIDYDGVNWKRNQDRKHPNITKQREIDHPPPHKPLERSEGIYEDSINPTDSSEIVETESKSIEENIVKTDIEKLPEENQHISEIFSIFGSHVDPQIRGLIRICIGNYLKAALEASKGDYSKWRTSRLLPRSIAEKHKLECLIEIILEGLNDEIHSCVNNSLLSITRFFETLTRSCHISSIMHILNSLLCVERNPYFLCKINLCKFYGRLQCSELNVLLGDWSHRCDSIISIVIKMLSENDQKVRTAASDAIASLAGMLYRPPDWNKTTSLIRNVCRHSEIHLLSKKSSTLTNFLHMQVLSDVPYPMGQAHIGSELTDFEYFDHIATGESLKCVLRLLLTQLMASSSKDFTLGLLETLRELTSKYPPWVYWVSYSDLGMLELMLQMIEFRTNTVQSFQNLIAIATQLYSVEAWKAIEQTDPTKRHEINTDEAKDQWSHFGTLPIAGRADHFLKITLKLLNVLVHLIEEVNPVAHNNKVLALPGSPIRKKSDANLHKHSVTSNEAADGPRKKVSSPSVTHAKTANPVGHFVNDSFFLKLYDSLKAVYSIYKVNLDTSESVFTKFLSVVLDALSTELEMMTDREAGKISEEILKYLKVTLPLKPDKTVFCVTQLMKCLFSLNMAKQYREYNVFFPQFAEKERHSDKVNFFKSIIDCRSIEPMKSTDSGSGNNANDFSKVLLYKCSEDRLVFDKDCLGKIESFIKQKIDRKLSTNKEELARYIGLFEPIVIQALKSYTIQNDLTLQCRVLGLLNQLLTLKVNYCLLDSDQIFIGFVLKQLEFIEQHEIINSESLVNGILVFLVQLSSAKHHTKQLMDVPKLIQLCDGLMAGGCDSECIASLRPLSYLVLRRQRNARISQSQDAKVAAEVVFAMLQKMMHHTEIIDLVSSVLLFSEDQAENNLRWSQLALDTLLSLLRQQAIPLNTEADISTVEKLLDCINKEVLFDQGKVELILKVLLDKPPDQDTSPLHLKERWLSMVLIFLRRVVSCMAESDLLLCLNCLKASHISPSAVFFDVKTEIDPLNVQNINENFANLSPDVIFVRFLFRVLTYSVLELDNCSIEDFGFEQSGRNFAGSKALLVKLVTSLICEIKQLLHLFEGCSFPLLAKTAQSVLQNEQSGLNTGLYSPEENIPLSKLNAVCLRLSWNAPLLTIHWSHLLIRLKFLEQKYWQKLLGYIRNSPLSDNSVNTIGVQNEVLQVGCVLVYCEYFIENGLDEAIHLTWLLVNRIHIMVTYFSEVIVSELIQKVNDNASASGLLLQAIAARCQNCIKGNFAINTYRILRNCHLSQSGALIFLISRILGKLQPSIALPFAKLASDRCEHLMCQDVDEVYRQLSKEDLQVALEMLQRDRIHIKFPHLISHINSLATMFFDLSPLDLSRDRPINPLYIQTCSVNSEWYFNQVKSRCCDNGNGGSTPGKLRSLALLLSNLNYIQIMSIMECPEFERNILCSCFELGCDTLAKAIANNLSDWEMKEDKRELARMQSAIVKDGDISPSTLESNILSMPNNFAKLLKSSGEAKSTFFIPITADKDLKQNFDNLKIEMPEEIDDFTVPDLPVMLQASVAALEKSIVGVTRLFPKQNRPLSQSETYILSLDHTLDRYTKRCHQVFREKMFYREFCLVQNLIHSYLKCLEKIDKILLSLPCELHQKLTESFLSKNLAKNLAAFTIITLQYASFLIKNGDSSAQHHGDVSFRSSIPNIGSVSTENMLHRIIENASKTLRIDEIFNEINTDANTNKIQSGINCLYTFVKHYMKEVRPITLRKFLSAEDDEKVPVSDLALTCDKLLTLICYWEDNFYSKNSTCPIVIMPRRLANNIEQLLVAFCRCDFASSFSLIPPLAWSSVDENIAKDGHLKKVDIPIQALQDMDVLQPFIFRVNLIGWTSKKHFEEIWMGLLNALQGNGIHWAIRAMMQLLITTLPNDSVLESTGHGFIHSPRDHSLLCDNTVKSLKHLSLECGLYDNIFNHRNFERYSLDNMDNYGQYHYQQLGLEYLKSASGLAMPSNRLVKNDLKLALRKLSMSGIDTNSCLQLLIEVINQMVHPQSPTGLGARVALVCFMANIGDLFTTSGQWEWLEKQFSLLNASSGEMAPLNVIAHQYIPYGLTKTNCVLDKEFTDSSLILSSLSSTFAPTRQSGMHAALLCLHHYQGLKKKHSTISQAANAMYIQMIVRLTETIKPHLIPNARISFYEQTLCWSVLFTLVELGSTDLVSLPTDFVINNPNHLCTKMIYKGILRLALNSQTCKELLKSSIRTLCKKMEKTSDQYLDVLFLNIFGNSFAKEALKSSPSDISNMDPDQLLNSMERITSLYSNVRNLPSQRGKAVCAFFLKHYLSDALPPASILSRVVVEFLDMCREAESDDSANGEWIMPTEKYGEIVFTVFQSSIALPQLSTLNVWLFETLAHLLGGKITPEVIPHCLLYLLLCASENEHLRNMIPFAAQSLKRALASRPADDRTSMKRRDIRRACRSLMTEGAALDFVEKRLLCLTAVHSNFQQQQVEKLRDLCSENETLKDLRDCLLFCKNN